MKRVFLCAAALLVLIGPAAAKARAQAALYLAVSSAYYNVEH